MGSDERIPRLHIAACSARCLAASLVGSLPVERLHGIDILATIREPVIISSQRSSASRVLGNELHAVVLENDRNVCVNNGATASFMSLIPQAVHRQLDYLVLSPNSSEKLRGPAHNSRRPSLVRFLLTSQWKIIIRADPPCPADKSRKSAVALIHKATSEFDEFPMISQASSLSVKPPGESARGFVPDSHLRRGREDILSEKRGKKEWWGRWRGNESSIVLRKRYGISPDVNRASRTKGGPLPSRHLSYSGSRYNMNSRVIDGGISYTW